VLFIGDYPVGLQKKWLMQMQQRAKNLETRKLFLIRRILEMSDEGELSLLENILVPPSAAQESIPPDVIKIIDERLAAFEENPNAGIAWESIRERLKHRYSENK